MRSLIVTKEFMQTLFVDSDKDENHKDLFKFLKDEVFDVKLICDFNSLEEFSNELAENPLWEMLMDKCEINYNINLEEDLKYDSFYEKLKEENIFLVSLPFENCDNLSKERGYIFISNKFYWIPRLGNIF